MGRARILIDGAPGRPKGSWDKVPKPHPKVVRGSGMKRAEKLQKLTRGTLEGMSGRKAYTKKEREDIFRESSALSGKQIEVGAFKVAVVTWGEGA